MELGIGSVHLRKVGSSNLDSFFGVASDLGYSYIDTSPFYSGALIERLLGDSDKAVRGFRLITKFGLPFHDLGTLKGRLRHRSHITNPARSVWGETISASSIPKLFSQSLSRLHLDSCFGYLMHSFDDSTAIDPWIEPLLQVKKSGRVQKIGLSVDSPTCADISWADILQIPTELIPWASRLGFKGRIMINQFMGGGDRDFSNRARLASTHFPNSIALIGTSNTEHLKSFAQMVGKHNQYLAISNRQKD